MPQVTAGSLRHDPSIIVHLKRASELRFRNLVVRNRSPFKTLDDGAFFDGLRCYQSRSNGSFGHL